MQLLAAPQALRRVDVKGSFPAYWPGMCVFVFSPLQEQSPGHQLFQPLVLSSRFKVYLKAASSLQTEAESKVIPAEQPTPFKKENAK